MNKNLKNMKMDPKSNPNIVTTKHRRQRYFSHKQTFFLSFFLSTFITTALNRRGVLCLFFLVNTLFDHTLLELFYSLIVESNISFLP